MFLHDYRDAAILYLIHLYLQQEQNLMEVLQIEWQIMKSSKLSHSLSPAMQHIPGSELLHDEWLDLLEHDLTISEFILPMDRLMHKYTMIIYVPKLHSIQAPPMIDNEHVLQIKMETTYAIFMCNNIKNLDNTVSQVF